VRRPYVRIFAGTLALALPLAAAAGCAVEKKRTIQAEFASASKHLQESKASSFTLRLDDGKKSLETLMTKKGDLAPELAQAFTGGSITVTVAGKSLSRDALGSSGDAAEQLKHLSMSIVVRDNKAELGELRLVKGVLYAHVGLPEISRLATLGGTRDLNSSLDKGVKDGPPALATLLTDVRAGKWVELDLTKYVDKLTQLAQGFTGLTPTTPPSTAAFDAQRLSDDLIAAVKPYVKVTDANDSSSDRVLDINVKARPALKAALRVMQGAKDLPFPNPFVNVVPEDIDAAIKDGNAHGQIRLKDGHLRSFSLDVESLRQLAVDPGTDSLAGLDVALDIDDNAHELIAPDNVSAVDVAALIDRLFKDLQSGTGQSSTTALAG
jgi:hypothetical protein